MASFPYVNVTDDWDDSNESYSSESTYFLDAGANNITFTFPDATTGNDACLFIFNRRDSSNPGSNTVTLATCNSQVFSTNAGDVSTIVLTNNQTVFIHCCNGGYRVL